MAHDHHDHHHHAVDMKHVGKAFVWGIVLNFAFVVVEVVVGLNINSLSLLSDAGHNLADVASLALSLFAFRLLKVKPSNTYTYGYKKTTILVALLNAVLLLVSIGAIGYEAIRRLIEPVALPGKTISIVAAVGIAINTLTAFFFFKSKDKDINVKSAFLHLVADAVVSAALVIGGIIIFYTNLFWIDAALSIIVAIVILSGTWHLLRESLRLSLDGVPAGIDIQEVQDTISKKSGVISFHHIHIWAISSTQNALTAHLVVPHSSTADEIEKLKADVKHELEHMNIQHATIEVEFENLQCKEDC